MSPAAVVASSRDLHDLLATLGTTADEVEASLLAAGCRGRRMAGCECPVARWLTERVANLEEISVCADTIRVWVWLGHDPVDPWSVTVETPAAVSALIVEFDQGRRPDLIQPPSEVPS